MDDTSDFSAPGNSMTNGFDGGPASSTIATHLDRTRPWVRFLGILAFVFAAFTICIGLLGGAGMALNRNPAGVAIFIIYPMIGALYGVPGVLLTRYANNIAQFVQSRQERDLAAALDAQRSFWKFAGIMGIVSIVMAVLVIPFAIMMGVLAAMSGAR